MMMDALDLQLWLLLLSMHNIECGDSIFLCVHTFIVTDERF